MKKVVLVTGCLVSLFAAVWSVWPRSDAPPKISQSLANEAITVDMPSGAIIDDVLPDARVVNHDAGDEVINSPTDAMVDRPQASPGIELPVLQVVRVPTSVVRANSLKLAPIKTRDVEDALPPTMMRSGQSTKGAVSSIGDAYSAGSVYDAPIDLIHSISRDTGIPSGDLQRAFD